MATGNFPFLLGFWLVRGRGVGWVQSARLDAGVVLRDDEAQGLIRQGRRTPS